MHHDKIHINLIQRFNELLSAIRNAGMSPMKYAITEFKLKNLLHIFKGHSIDLRIPSEHVKVMLVSRQDEEFQQIFDCLLEFHQEKLKNAPYIGIAFAQINNGSDAELESKNREKMVQTFLTECAIKGLKSNILLHNLAGFYKERVTNILPYPTNYEPIAMFAVGPQKIEDFPVVQEMQHDDSIPETIPDDDHIVMSPKWSLPVFTK